MYGLRLTRLRSPSIGHLRSLIGSSVASSKPVVHSLHVLFRGELFDEPLERLLDPPVVFAKQVVVVDLILDQKCLRWFMPGAQLGRHTHNA